MLQSYFDTERRKKSRLKVNCRCWLEDDSCTLFGTVTNLSQDGFFVRTVPAMIEGACVEIKLNIGKGVVQAKGRVKWRNESLEGEVAHNNLLRLPPGLGIELVEFESGSDLFSRFITKSGPYCQ